MSTSLRYRDLITDRMVDTPERVKLYVTLLNGATPTVGYGGARYLHLCRGHYVYQHHVLHSSGVMPELYRQDLTITNKAHIRFERTDLELSNLPNMERAIDWAAGLMAEVQEGLPHPTMLVVHRGLMDSIARYDLALISYGGLYKRFSKEAGRTKRPQRFLVLEWIRLDVLNRAPAFIALFDNENFFQRFKGYSDTVRRMYQLATDREPLDLPPLLKAREREKANELEDHKYKLQRLEDAAAQQRRVVEEITNPWLNLDSDTLRAKPVSLPRTAGVVRPARVILPVGRWRNKGRDITAVEAEHDDSVTYERAEIAKPWKSRKRLASPEAGPSYERAIPELRPVIGPVPLREPGEREHRNHARLTKAAKRTRFIGGVLHAVVANPDYGSCSGREAGQSRQMTQDEVEESTSSTLMEPFNYDESGDMLNFDDESDLD